MEAVERIGVDIDVVDRAGHGNDHAEGDQVFVSAGAAVWGRGQRQRGVRGGDAEGVQNRCRRPRQQAGQPRRERAAGLSSSTAGLRTDLELARAEIRALRAERDQLKTVVRRGLGQQLDQIASRELIERINELTERNRTLSSSLRGTQAENRRLADRVAQAEEDRDGARTSLRGVLRDPEGAASAAAAAPRTPHRRR